MHCTQIFANHVNLLHPDIMQFLFSPNYSEKISFVADEENSFENLEPHWRVIIFFIFLTLKFDSGVMSCVEIA